MKLGKLATYHSVTGQHVITDELNNENYNEISDFTNELSLLQYCITCLVNERYRLIQCSES